MNKLELEIAIKRHGTTISKLSESIGMNRVTFYRKLTTGKFERSEIVRIRDELSLSEADMLRIFFDSDSCGNAT